MGKGPIRTNRGNWREGWGGGGGSEVNGWVNDRKVTARDTTVCKC